MQGIFSVVNDGGEALLEEADITLLDNLFERHSRIMDREEWSSPEEIREFFSKSIQDVVAPEKIKNSSLSHLDSYVHWYSILEEIFWGEFLEWEDRPSVYDTLWIPYSSFELRSSFPYALNKILRDHAGIMESFLPEEYSHERKLRIIEAFLANRVHPLGMNEYDDYSWLSARWVYICGQNIHGDVHFRLCEKKVSWIQMEIFSSPSTDEIEWQASESLHIYQYTESLVGLICRYSLHTGYMPEELENWEEIMGKVRSVIPNAATAGPIDKDPKYIASGNGWGKSSAGMDVWGEYVYLGNAIISQPPERYTTALLHGESLIFAVIDDDGAINFPCPDGRILSFRKTFEIAQADIGPMLRALFHLPGRSSADNRIVLRAYDWARVNGYMSKRED